MTAAECERLAARGHALTVTMLTVGAVFYAWLLTRGSFDPFGAEPLGLTFNSMLSHMLAGRWDVDPAAIGHEAFVHHGLTYAYFGPFPAMLRLPLVMLPHWLVPDWRSLHVERLSCWLAIMCGLAAQASAVAGTLTRAAMPIRAALAAPLIVLCTLSGPPMLLSWRGAPVYHEAILWAWALAMAFVAVALPAVQRQTPFGCRPLCALGVCAGLCLLTRSTTGAGLYLAVGLLLLVQVGREGWRAGLRWSFWAPAGVLTGFIVLTGIVNQGRWGNPLVFADLHTQATLIERFPDRLARLERYGLFDWRRLDIGALYYVLPVWTDQLERVLPLSERLARLYDAIEQPASSLLLTDPAWCLLSVLGVGAFVGGRASAREALLVAGLSLAPVLMLAAWYLAFRYRAEFAPLLLVLSCIAIGRLTPGVAQRRLGWVLSVLCVLQVGGAVLAGWAYARQPFGPSPGYAGLSLRCVVAPASCLPASDDAGESGR